jgi:hypothetical protein
MTSAKHSAAPRRHTNKDGQPILTKGREFPVCYLDTGSDINEVGIRLLCAAPELLAALAALARLADREAAEAGEIKNRG